MLGNNMLLFRGIVLVVACTVICKCTPVKDNVKSSAKKEVGSDPLVRIFEANKDVDFLCIDCTYRNSNFDLLDSLKNLTSIKLVCSSANFDSVIISQLARLKKLREIEIILDEPKLPSNVWQMVDLEILKIRANVSLTLSGRIQELQNLKELEIHAGLDYLPIEVASLQKLESVDLSQNNLKIFPQSVLKLAQLKYLNLSRNLINSVPEKLVNLDSLKELNLSITPLGIREEAYRRVKGKYNELLPLAESLPNCQITLDDPLTHEEVDLLVKEMDSIRVGKKR